MNEVVKAGHPMDMATFLPHRLQDLLEEYAVTDCAKRAGDRVEAMKFWLKRAIELKDSERDLHPGLDESVATVLKGKRVLLWKQMLEAINYEDMSVVQEFTSETPLIGQSEETGLWPKKFKPASMSQSRPLLTYKSFEFMDDDVMDAVWSQTLDEVAKGELTGLFSLDEIPETQPLSKRFGVKQSSKVRCVDDFTQSSISARAQTCESPKPHTVDIICSMCFGLMKVTQAGTKWQARSFGLKRAYRQCSIKPSRLCCGVIAVADPHERSVKCFRMQALPFGSVMWVHSFLREAHSLWEILVSVFKVFLSNYFDHLVVFSTEAESQSVTAAVTTAFKTLGWVFAETGDKAPPFSELVTALGVVIDVSKLHLGSVTVDNTVTRKKEISASLRHVLDTRKLHRHEALKLRGRLQFVAGQIFGRVAKCCLALVTYHAYSEHGPEINGDARAALTLFLQLLAMKIPRQISSRTELTWFLFTDACFEPSDGPPTAGVGAILVDQFGRKKSFISVFSQKASFMTSM